MSQCESSAMKLPSSSCASGLISASVRPYVRNARAIRATMRESWFSSLPVMPSEATSSLNLNSCSGWNVEKCARATCSGCCSATSSMSMPPMSLKIATGSLATASKTMPA